MRRALEDKDLRLVSELLPEGVNANSKRGTCLHLAAARRREDICLRVLDADFLALNAVDRTGSTALHYAAAQRLGTVCLRILNHPDFSAGYAASEQKKPLDQVENFAFFSAHLS